MVFVTERVTLEIIRGWHKTLSKPQRNLLFMDWIDYDCWIAHYKYFQYMGMLVWALQSIILLQVLFCFISA